MIIRAGFIRKDACVKRITFLALTATLAIAWGCVNKANAADTPFEKGLTDFSLSASYIQPVRFSEDRLYNFNLAYGWYFMNNN